MKIKNLTDLLKGAEEENVDKILLEYILVLIGAKKTLDNVKELVLNSKKDTLSKNELLEIIESKNTDIDM